MKREDVVVRLKGMLEDASIRAHAGLEGCRGLVAAIELLSESRDTSPGDGWVLICDQQPIRMTIYDGSLYRVYQRRSERGAGDASGKGGVR